MDFGLSPEQTLLQDNLRRLIARRFSFAARRGASGPPDGLNAEAWSAFAELGVLGLGVPEAQGGLGAAEVETMLVMEELGRGLVVGPFLSTMVLGAPVLASSPQADLLAQVAGGQMRLALAHDEAAFDGPDGRLSAAARRTGGGWRLDGAKAVVLDGGDADRLIVSAHHGDAAGTSEGMLFLVDPRTPGVARRSYKTHDGGQAADITLRSVEVGDDGVIAQGAAARQLIDGAHERAIAAVCAEAVGAMGALIEMTVDYVKTRKQFGQPIGGFQAVQHRLADMLVHAELARSMAYLATGRLAAPTPDERTRALSAAKHVVGRAARFVGQEAIQLHGGVGLTEDYAAGHYFKRLTMIELSFGDTAHHLARFSDAMTAPAG